MTEIAALPLRLTPGKHNMASQAFADLRQARSEGNHTNGPDLSFSDLVDTINPLQHVPVVGEAYRAVTDDVISPVARVAGGLLYGGPIGFVASMFDSVIEAVTGSDIGEHVVATLFGGDDKPETTPPAETKVAEAVKPAAPPVAEANQNSDHAGPRMIAPSIMTAIPAKPAPDLVAAGKPDPETTASIGLPGSAPKAQAAPMPQLSSEAFNALINSFADPKATSAANADIKLADNKPELQMRSTLDSGNSPRQIMPPLTAAKDVSVEMQQALDKLDALKKSQSVIN